MTGMGIPSWAVTLNNPGWGWGQDSRHLGCHHLPRFLLYLLVWDPCPDPVTSAAPPTRSRAGTPESSLAAC